MKNTKKVDNKKIKKPQTKTIKPPPLVFTQSNSPPFDGKAALNTILSSSTKKAIKVFSEDQQKIIQQQFAKMVKNLQKKLTSPQKAQNSQRSNKLQTKTQRFEFIDPNSCSKQTIKKNNKTQRKIINSKSPKSYSKVVNKQQKLTIPLHKTNKNSSSQLSNTNCRKSEPLKSPKKLNKCTVDYNSAKKQQKIKSQTKRKQTKSNQQYIQNYLLIDDKFVELSQNQQKLKQLQSQLMQQSTYHSDKQINLEFQWGQFFDQKNKISQNNQLIFKQIKKQERNDENIKSEIQSYEINQSNIKSPDSSILLKNKKRPQNYGNSSSKKSTNQQFFDQFYNQGIVNNTQIFQNQSPQKLYKYKKKHFKLKKYYVKNIYLQFYAIILIKISISGLLL